MNAGNDYPLASPRADQDKFLAFSKGTLVTLLLSKEIYLRSNGVFTFDDFDKLLFRKYGFKARYLEEEELKAELAILTGTDFSQFFNDYVYGTAPIPIEWAFQDADADGLSNCLEIGWDTHPLREDTDGDGCGDGEEIRLGFDPLDPSSFPRLVYLPIAVRDFVPPALPIDIDGSGQDWQSYAPLATDPQGDMTGGPHTDLKAVYFERDPNYLYVMVEMYDPPLPSEGDIQVSLALTDSTGRPWRSSIHVESGGSLGAGRDYYDDEWESYAIPGAACAWGDVLELRLPFRALGNPLTSTLTVIVYWSVSGQTWSWQDMIIP